MPNEIKYPLLRISASAGAGKTYTLTQRFLSLLRKADGAFSSGGCALVCPDRTYTLPEILAATFTNKAAAEMKQRVVKTLKEEALAEGPIAENSSRWVDTILRHYSLLNIRTIDSLLSNLVRLSALELNLPPDFELFFTPEEFFTPVYEGLMDDIATHERLKAAALGWGEPLENTHEPDFLTSDGAHLSACLEEACRSLLFQDKSKGFTIKGKLHDSVYGLIKRLMSGKAVPAMDSAGLKAELFSIHGAMRNAAGKMRQRIELEGLAASKLFLAYIDKCLAAPPYALPSVGKQAEKTSLDDCLNKSSKGLASEEAEKVFETLQGSVAEFSIAAAVLVPALQLAPLVDLSLEVFARMEQSGMTESRVPLARVPALAKKTLRGELGVPDALCRMGNRLTHIMLDEFQDTSQEQWEAIMPLGLECLANNGSLTYVGDVKQAIYSWRGGATRLFETAALEPELNAVSGGYNHHELTDNWRSAPAIVAHNNAFFSLLADREIAESVLSAMLPEKTPARFINSAAEDCARIFAGAGQNIPEERQKNCFAELEENISGVSLYEVEGTNSASVDALVRTRLQSLLLDELQKRWKYSDIAVLVRSGTEASLVSSWLVEWGLPVVTENSYRLKDHPLILGLTALLSFLDYPLDDLPFWEFISSGECFGKVAGLERKELADWLARLTVKSGKNRPPLFQAFKRSYPEQWDKWLAPFHTQSGLMSAYDTLVEAMRRFSLFERYPEQRAFLERFLEIAYLAENQGKSSIASFLVFWKEAGDDEKIPLPETMDAIRILTMHKAKGLEFPVVILPFSHRGRRGTPELGVFNWKGREILTLAGSHMEEEYYSRLIVEELERLNLLYVAWTRPVSELHAFLTRPGKMLGHFPLGKGLAALSEAYKEKYANSLCSWESIDEESILQPERECDIPSETGQVITPAEEEILFEPHMQGETDWRPMAWLPRLKIYRTTLKDTKFTPERRGTLAHLCLEHLILTRPDEATARAEDVERAVLTGMRFFPLPIENPEDTAGEMRRCLEWFAALPQAPGWLAYGKREQSIMDETGNMHRVDLLARETTPEGGNLLRAVDYKTGHAPEGYAEYHSQVRRYMDLLQKAQPLPVAGTLVYLDERRLEEVG